MADASTNIKDQIKKLIELQKIDSEIYEQKEILDEKPKIIAQLKEEFEESKSKLDQIQDQLKKSQVARKDLEVDLKSKEEQIAKANTQLSQIKTNKEYTAKISEIENIKADKSQMEEKILVSFDEQDRINSEIDKEKIKVAEREKVFLSQKKEIEDAMKLAQDRIKVLEGQRKQIVPDIEVGLLKSYEKILQHKKGLALVAVNGSSCGGCYMNITTQEINILKMHNEIIYCGSCARMLYIEENL